MKRIVLLNTDGTEEELKLPLPLETLQAKIGGYIEHVRVMDRTENGQAVYTSMFVHDTGLIDGLPRNEKATEIYQRNVRFHFPNAADPFKAADEALRGDKAFTVDLTPEHIKKQAEKDGPWIAGPAIYFEGYTIEEVDEALSA